MYASIISTSQRNKGTKRPRRNQKQNKTRQNKTGKNKNQK